MNTEARAILSCNVMCKYLKALFMFTFFLITVNDKSNLWSQIRKYELNYSCHEIRLNTAAIKKAKIESVLHYLIQTIIEN